MTTNRPKVLVPITMGRAGIDHFSARDDIELIKYPPAIAAADLAPLLADAQGIALSFTPYRAADIAASPMMRVAARIGVGFDSVEVPALTARRIPLMVVGTANSSSVAEQAVFFVMALAKRGGRLDRLVRDGDWADRYQHLPMEVAGKIVLIVGFGRIGTRAARRFAAMDMTVLVHDPFVPASQIQAAGYTPAPDLDGAVSQADFISIHCPKSPETVDMFDAARLARMKRGAFLVNTARGGIVNEPALHDALVSGHVAGAGLDVLADEPPDLANPLLKLPNVIVSPHVAGNTAEAVQAMALMTARNILSVLDGVPIAENVVNKDVLVD